MAAPAAKAELERPKGTVDMTGLPDGEGAGETDAGTEGMGLAGAEGLTAAALGLAATTAVPPGDAVAPQAPTRSDAAATATKTGALRHADRGPLRMNGS